MSEFKIPPISTLIGSNLINFIRVVRSGGRVEPRFYLKMGLTALVVLLASPFHLWEYFFFRKKIRDYRIKKEPLFILGHWRSGTTFLHNMLCADPRAGYMTTYHSVFPNNLGSKFVFKTFMKMNMPDKRPSDNVKLGIDLPQEDEFALSNLTDKSFYHFFYFPAQYKKYYRDSVTDVNNGLVQGWDQTYRELIIKALLNAGGERIVLKNPVNTGRIKTLLRMFPDAKFIFIHRNPVTVFLSTRKFFRELFPTLWFHETGKEFIDEMIFENFKVMMEDYEKQKLLIPQRNLMELRFESFEQDPLEHCRRVYSDLLEDDFLPAEPFFDKFIKSQKGYTKNKYRIEKSLVDRITMEWGPYLTLWNYSLPDELILDEEN